ncbi:hypothetical protein B0H11DRAFT_2099314 [Mycena galericulata]|nr:hypothetical protein B0H11DRAFT_2099314 [Mycena galericulata]
MNIRRAISFSSLLPSRKLKPADGADASVPPLPPLSPRHFNSNPDPDDESLETPRNSVALGIPPEVQSEPSISSHPEPEDLDRFQALFTPPSWDRVLEHKVRQLQCALTASQERVRTSEKMIEVLQATVTCQQEEIMYLRGTIKIGCPSHNLSKGSSN